VASDKRSDLTVERLPDYLHFDPDTGVFTRLISTSPNARAGDVAGWINKGYLQIRIDGRKYLAHRLAFFYMTGKFPIDQIDHINMDKSDNRWVNLREATNAQNQANIHARITNTSGHKGVSWRPREKKWRACIGRNGHHHHLGYFDNSETATAAYETAAKKHFGEFARVTSMKTENTVIPVQADQSAVERVETPPDEYYFKLEGEHAARCLSIPVAIVAAIVSCAKVTNITVE